MLWMWQSPYKASVVTYIYICDLFIFTCVSVCPCRVCGSPLIKLLLWPIYIFVTYLYLPVFLFVHTVGKAVPLQSFCCDLYIFVTYLYLPVFLFVHTVGVAVPWQSFHCHSLQRSAELIVGPRIHFLSVGRGKRLALHQTCRLPTITQSRYMYAAIISGVCYVTNLPTCQHRIYNTVEHVLTK